MKATLEKITNSNLDNFIFRQASLPVKLGGLGIRRTQDISLPAFISSCKKSVPIINEILTNTDAANFHSLSADSITSWKSLDTRLIEPLPSASTYQKSWDLPVADLVLKDLLSSTADEASRSRILAVSAPFSGAWLNATPISTLGSVSYTHLTLPTILLV